MLCSVCGTEYEGNVCPNCSRAANPYAADPQPAKLAVEPATEQGDGTGGIIPYKNPKALLAYYLGILSGLPLIGLPFGIAAFVLGIQGLRARKKNPAIKGSVHAGIGIGCGAIFTLLWGGLIGAFVVAYLSRRF